MMDVFDQEEILRMNSAADAIVTAGKLFTALDILREARISVTRERIIEAEFYFSRRLDDDYERVCLDHPEEWSEDGLSLFVHQEHSCSEDEIDRLVRDARKELGMAIEMVDSSALSPKLREEMFWHLHGLCFPMAQVLHRRTGLPLVVITDICGGFCDNHECDGSCVGSVHAAVQLPDGRIVDAIGVRTIEHLLRSYQTNSPGVYLATEESLSQFSGVLDEIHLNRAAALLDALENHPCQKYRRRDSSPPEYDEPEAPGVFF